MAIAAADIKLRQSQRLTDNPDGGGRMVQTEVVDGALNNLFPDIGDEERTTGRTVLRKAFVHVDTANTDVLKDAIAAIVKRPDDSHVHMTMFGLGSYSDVRSDARGRIESYITKGVESRYILMGDHYVGQQALMLCCLPDAPTPEINDNLCLSTSGVGYTPNEQYLRVKSIFSRETQTFIDNDNVAFQRDVIIVETVTALLYPFYGQSPTRFSSTKPPTRVHDTNVIEAQTYATVKPLSAVAESGALKVLVDSPFVPIVPSTQAETPVVDQLAGNGTVSYVTAGAADLLSHSYSAAFTAGIGIRRYLGSPFARGSVKVTAGAVELTDDGSGTLVTPGSSPWGGSVDYEAGSVEVLHSDGTSSTSISITATPAAPVVMQGYSDFIGITPGNQGFTYVLQLNPLPAPGTVTVDFRALGRWIRLSDNGTGQLVGRPGQGSGSINYATGSVIVTCGALPDLSSQILASWGTGVITERRDADVAIVPPALRFMLPDQGIKPASASIAWLVSSATVTATDDGAGVLKVGATVVGTINYATGEVNLQLSTLPDPSSLIHSAYDWAEQTQASFTPVPDGGGLVSFNLGATGLRPGGVRLDWLTSVRPANVIDVGAPVVALRIEARDDGAGQLVAVSAGGIRLTGNLGTINYTTGAVSLQAGQISIPNVPFPNYEQSYVNQYWRISGKTRAAGLATYSAGTQINAAWQLAAALDNDGEDEIALPPVELDLTPGIIDAIVPGGVRFTFRGRTYVDRAGSLYFNIDPLTGAGTYAGSVDYASGKATISNWAAGGANGISIQALLTRMFEPGTDALYFRTPGSPLRAGAFTLRATTLEGDLLTASADISGNLVAAGIDGTVEWETGVVRVRFGAMVPAAGNEAEPWYDPANVVGSDVWKPHLVIPSTIFFGAVVFRSIPLSSVVVGLDPTRLPSDGRVPGFRAGQTLLVFHEDEVSVTPTAGQVVSVGRTGLSQIEVRDAAGVPILSSWYTPDLDAGEVAFADPLNLTAYTMPVKIRHRIDNRRLCAGVQITGEIELNSALSREFPAGSMVASVLRLGEPNGSLDLVARVSNLFDQAAWTSVWSDVLIGSAASGTYNDTDYPLEVTNADAITERWVIRFTSATGFELIGETVGVIATGSTAADLAPINPRTGQPYARIRKEGWGGGWATNNAVRFNTIGGLAPVWFARTTLAGTPEEVVDDFRFQVIGNSAGVTP